MNPLEDKIETLKQHILESGVLDGADIHHEFVSGLHGRKIDFDTIPTDSELYRLWVEVTADYILTSYAPLPEMILGTANGANRLAVSVAAKIQHGILGLTTQKLTAKSVELSTVAEEFITSLTPQHVLILEDVGTSGTTSATAALSALKHGAIKVTVLNTWQRSDTLKKLEENNIEWQSIIHERLPNFTPEECRENGLCAQEITLIPHAK